MNSKANEGVMGDASAINDSESNRERFSNGISDFFVTLEDLRQSLREFEKSSTIHQPSKTKVVSPAVYITVDVLQEWRHLMERMVRIALFLIQIVSDEKNSSDGNTFNEEMEMLQHTMAKALDTTKHILYVCCSQYTEPTTDDAALDPALRLEEQRRLGQACVARIAEMNIVLAVHSLQVSSAPPPQSSTIHSATKDGSKFRCYPPMIEEIVEQYVQFQRRTFRLRCKPSIAHLVDVRCQQKIFAPMEGGWPFVSSDASVPPAFNALNSHGDETEVDEIAPVVINSMHQSKEIHRRTQQDQRLALLMEQHHAPVFTIVLGVAATLIHPLSAWRTTSGLSTSVNRSSSANSIPGIVNRMCLQSISVIHEQTEALVKTISEWFYLDRKDVFDVSSALDDSVAGSATSSFTVKREQQIGQLAVVVEEMAYIAQILERYLTLVGSALNEEIGCLSGKNTIANTILPEWIWQYSALERRLVVQQWKMSLLPSPGRNIGATPVCIVIGTEIRVSSCIEDAQYITSRAMDRAISTYSLHAMATIAYAITRDIWATEAIEDHSSESMTVYKALWEEIGCWSEPESESMQTADNTDSKKMPNVASPSSGGFATALLDALDEDMDRPPTGSSNRSPGSRIVSPTKPPLSGGTGFLSSLILSSAMGVGNEKIDQRQLDTLFCVCNSLQAASDACRSLVNSLDEILGDHGLLPEKDSNVMSKDEVVAETSTPLSESEGEASQSEVTKKSVALIQLARDELLQYSGQYLHLLNDRIEDSIRSWCYSRSINVANVRRSSGCLDALHEFFENEKYDIDGSTLTRMEADERLENEMLRPLKESALLCQMTNKCEAPILRIFSERIATMVVDMLLDILWGVDENCAAGVDTETSLAHSRNQNVTKRFTDWGALLLSKQSRMLQHFISSTMTQRSSNFSNVDDASNVLSAASMTTSTMVFHIWERVSHVLTILQLEKPMDWLIYHATSKLTPTEVSRTMHLRIDFSNDAVEKVVADIRGNPKT